MKEAAAPNKRNDIDELRKKGYLDFDTADQMQKDVEDYLIDINTKRDAELKDLKLRNILLCGGITIL